MREGWKTGRLGDFFEIVTGGTPPKSKAEMYGNFMPFVKPPELSGQAVRVAKDNLSPLGAKASRVLAKNSILVSCIGNLGKIGISEVPLATNQQINSIKPNEKEAFPQFMFYLVMSDHFNEQLLNLASGTTVPIVNKSKFASINIELPPLPEQKCIVAILDEAFAGLETAVANTEKNLANARELFESYLKSVFSNRNKNWSQKKLKDVCIDYGRGKSKHRPRNDPKLYGGDYPFVQTGDVRHSDHIITTFTSTYNEIGLAQSKLWPKGTICITIAANIAETGILNFDACFPDSIIGLVVDENQANNDFVEYLLQSKRLDLQAKGKGSAQDNINLSTFKSEYFPFPILEKQKKIAENLMTLANEVRHLETIHQQKLTALAELKQSLLQKAFSGELTTEKAENRMPKAAA